MTNFGAIEKWYGGKALQTLRDSVIPTLAEAEAQGYWPKGASRRVCAALNKQAVAQKFARLHERGDREHAVLDAGGYRGLLCDVVKNRKNPYCGEGGQLVSAMQFGSFMHAPALLAVCDACDKLARNDAERHAVDRAREWCRDFAPVAELVKLLDSRRPPIRVTFGTISKTVLDNMVGDLAVKLDTARLPEFKTRWVEVEVKGRKQMVCYIEIVWPEGAVHNASRYARSSGAYHQCHACGHAIRNGWNWVPVVVDRADGAPFSFWIGKDCARNLFNAEVEGDAVFAERAAAVRR